MIGFGQDKQIIYYPDGKAYKGTLDEQEIQKVKVDLESLFSLKSLLISKGLYNNQCAITT
jgi:hypothetical protein